MKNERDRAEMFACAQASRQMTFLRKEAERAQGFLAEETEREAQFRNSQTQRESQFEKYQKELQTKSVASEEERRSEFDRWEQETMRSSDGREEEVRIEFATEERSRDKIFEASIAAILRMLDLRNGNSKEELEERGRRPVRPAWNQLRSECAWLDTSQRDPTPGTATFKLVFWLFQALLAVIWHEQKYTNNVIILFHLHKKLASAI